MKSVKRTAKAALLGGLLGLVAATGSGCAGSNAPLRTYINSSHAQRELLREQDVAEETLKTGRVQEGHVLYVPMTEVGEVLAAEFGVDINKRGFRSLYEGNSVEINYRSPQSGEIISETQKVTNECTIDTLDFGSFDACVPRSQLDDAITAVARTKGIESVSVKETDHPMTETSEFFIGKAWYFGEDAKGNLVSGGILAPAALKAHRIMLETGIGHNADYVAVVMAVPATNGIDRVVAVAPAYDVISGRTTMCVGHDDVLFATGTNSYQDLRSLLQEVGGLFNDVSGVSDAIQNMHYSADRGFRRNYLDGKSGPRESGLQKAGRVVGEAGLVKAGVKALSE